MNEADNINEFKDLLKGFFTPVGDLEYAIEMYTGTLPKDLYSELKLSPEKRIKYLDSLAHVSRIQAKQITDEKHSKVGTLIANELDEKILHQLQDVKNELSHGQKIIAAIGPMASDALVSFAQLVREIGIKGEIYNINDRFYEEGKNPYQDRLIIANDMLDLTKVVQSNNQFYGIPDGMFDLLYFASPPSVIVGWGQLHSEMLKKVGHNLSEVESRFSKEVVRITSDETNSSTWLNMGHYPTVDNLKYKLNIVYKKLNTLVTKKK